MTDDERAQMAEELKHLGLTDEEIEKAMSAEPRRIRPASPRAIPRWPSRKWR